MSASGHAFPTLLACGVVAGPLYVAVTMAQALTRDGFELGRHPFNVLTTGDLGWIQRGNLALTWAWVMALAVHLYRRVERGDRDAVRSRLARSRVLSRAG